MTAKRKRRRNRQERLVHAQAPRPAARLRLWAFRAGAAVLVPLLLLGVAEGVLRIARVGHPTGFLVSLEGADARTTNPFYGWRFFPPTLARTPPTFVMPTAKAAGTYRVFVLGGSAAMGTPDAAFGLARVLGVMLGEAMPEQDVEVYNVAMTAINSHVVRDIARECARHEPDLMVVYLGNNEVVGPYGPGTVFQSLSSSRLLVRAGMWVRSLRLAQAMDAGMRRLVPSRLGSEWRGMEMFVGRRVTADDPRLEQVYASLLANLTDITRAARRAGAEVVISTVATNLKDSPPFASEHRRGLGDDEMSRWQSAFAAGVALAAAADHEGAASAFRQALATDDRHAELHYRLARSLLVDGRQEEAREHFVAARDLDALRFRADSRINTIIREVAAAFGTILVDGERAVGSAPETGDGIAGDELLYEHVHLRFDGTYRLAAAVLEAVRQQADDQSTVTTDATVLSIARCAELLALTPWDRYRMESEIARMVARPPFVAQPGHAERARRVRERLRTLQEVARESLDASESLHAQMVERLPDDLPARAKLAALLLERGKAAEAARHWRQLVDMVPGNVAWRSELGSALLESGRTAEALSHLRRVVALRPGFPSAHVNLGLALKRGGDSEAAIAAFQAALELEPGFVSALLNLGSMLVEIGRLGEAEAHYQAALERDPRAAEVHFGLGHLRERQGRTDEAIAAYRQALAIAPEMARAANNLGYVLAQVGRSSEAEEAYRRAVEADPSHALARFNLGDLYLSAGRAADAVGSYRGGLTVNPGNLQARLNTAVALQMIDRPRQAAAEYREILVRQPDSPQTMLGLAYLLATVSDRELRDPDEAVRLAEEARRLTGDRVPEVLQSLALIYGAVGDQETARRETVRALALARKAGDEALVRQLAAQLEDLSVRSQH